MTPGSRAEQDPRGKLSPRLAPPSGGTSHRLAAPPPPSPLPPTEFGTPGQAVAAYNAAGIPAVLTPCKGPRWKGWSKRRDRVVDEAEQSEMLAKYRTRGNRLGVAVILGDLARYLVFDFDAPSAFASWKDSLPVGLADHVDLKYPIVRSPKGHIGHVYVPIAAEDLKGGSWFGGMVLDHPSSWVPARNVVEADGAEPVASIAIELRVPNKHSIMAPGSGYGVHDKFPKRTWVYERADGPRIENLSSLPPVTEEQLAAMLTAAQSVNDPRADEIRAASRERTAGLHALARKVDDLPGSMQAAVQRALSTASGENAGELPGEDFNARGTWEDVLEPVGWAKIGEDTWRRPGGSGTTASTKHGALVVFSTNAHPLESIDSGDGAYSKFAALAILQHGGDYSAAAKALASKGYGSQRRRRRSPPQPVKTSDGAPKGLSADPRPTLLLRPGYLAHDLDTAETHLVQAEAKKGKMGCLFTLGGVLVHRLLGEAGDVAFSIVKPEGVRDHMGREVLFQRDGYDSIEPVDLPLGHAKAYLARDQFAHPPLRAIVRTPLLRVAGTLLAEPGYDRSEGVWIDIPPGGWPAPISDAPSMDDARTALAHLAEPFKDMTWKGAEDRAVALAAILTTLGRNLFPAAPMFAITATTRGTGKSLLAECVAAIGTGKRAAMLQLSSEEELSKAVHAFLLESRALICIDNIDRPLESSSLCTALTQSVFSRRVLGVSRTASPSTTGTTWLATGNNLSIKGDLTRRVLVCDIDSGVERPEERVFDRDLLPWVESHRHELVAAGLTVLCAFLLAGCPAPKPGLKPFGGFEEWSRIVRGALVWLGEPDPCQTRDRAIDDDPEREDLSRLLAGLVSVFGSERFQAKEVRGKTDREGELLSILRDLLGEADVDSTRLIGNLLRRFKGRWVDGARLVDTGKKQNAVVWRVERKVADAGSATGEVQP